MDETIGVKGGKQDRRRTLKIEKNKKKKLEEAQEIKELEKKVRKKQIFTLVKALPIALGGGFIKTIYDNAIGKTKKDKEEENSKWRIKEYDADISPKTKEEYEIETLRKKKPKIITTPTGEKIIIYINTDINEYKHIEEKSKAEVLVKDQEKKEDKKEQPKETVPEGRRFIFTGIDKPKKQEEQIEQIDVIKKQPQETKGIDVQDISEETKERIRKLKSKAIVDVYEKKLKDIRYELRKAIFEYNVLLHEEQEIVLRKDAEVILDRLSELIDKIEKLKASINIDNIDKYDDNYIYYLIEEYLDDFKNKQIVREIKESPLYILISEKIDEIDKKKEDLNNRLDQKKNDLEEKEIDFEKLKNKYYSIDKINNQLIEFQESQERLLEEIRRKVESATTITEKIEYEFIGMNKQSKKLLKLMSFQMFLPGPKVTKGILASVAAYMNFLGVMVNPELGERTYKVIEVKDYSNEIRNSIGEIDNAINLLGKTSSDIDKMIKDINNKFRDYFGVVKECDEMLNNLYKIKMNLSEKEYEMEKLKYQQEKELEKNEAKVLTRGTYPVK